MVQEIAFENGKISNFQGLVTLDRVILHTVVHHSSTFKYMPDFSETEETFCGRMYICTVVHLRPNSLGLLTRADLKMSNHTAVTGHVAQPLTTDGKA